MDPVPIVLSLNFSDDRLRQKVGKVHRHKAVAMEGNACDWSGVPSRRVEAMTVKQAGRVLLNTSLQKSTSCLDCGSEVNFQCRVPNHE